MEMLNKETRWILGFNVLVINILLTITLFTTLRSQLPIASHMEAAHPGVHCIGNFLIRQDAITASANTKSRCTEVYCLSTTRVISELDVQADGMYVKERKRP